MKAKRNRYDLSLWDVRKLSLYGSAVNGVQAATLSDLILLSILAASIRLARFLVAHRDGLDNSTSTKTE